MNIKIFLIKNFDTVIKIDTNMHQRFKNLHVLIFLFKETENRGTWKIHTPPSFLAITKCTQRFFLFLFFLDKQCNWTSLNSQSFGIVWSYSKNVEPHSGAHTLMIRIVYHGSLSFLGHIIYFFTSTWVSRIVQLINILYYYILYIENGILCTTFILP